ncbi:uncharacterized protein LOC143236926 [Tachypleus tridentatus]|uniref:uncharacterized protein LOC143236926 n=1 Tax=Tachypleus tridentatus TaxID=6853 RepID=UPI003FD18762
MSSTRQRYAHDVPVRCMAVLLSFLLVSEILNATAFDGVHIFEDCTNEDVIQAHKNFTLCLNSEKFFLKEVSLKSLKNIKTKDGYENLCRSLKSVIRCSQIFQEMSCLMEPEQSNLRDYTTVMTAGVEYFCNKKENNLRRFYAADGIECIERSARNSTSFQQCVKNVRTADISNKLLSKHFCIYGKDLSHCIRRLIKDCRKAKNVIQGFMATIFKAGNCDKLGGNSSPSVNKLEVLGVTSLAVGLLLL